MKRKVRVPINPRLITDESISQACDACVALWINWMRESKYLKLNHLKTRNVAEWLASAAGNAWVMHDNCDANMLVAEAMHEIGLLEGDNPDEIPEDEGMAAYNDALWKAVAHQSGDINRSLLLEFLKKRHCMNKMEIERFIRVLDGSPEEGLEQACKRALLMMKEPIRQDKTSSVSDAEATIVMLLELPEDEISRLAREAERRLESDGDGLQNSVE